MKQIIGRKQNTDNAKWIEAVSKIEELVSKEELDSVVDKTKEEIKSVTAGKKAAYAWSGGKDSLVLESICNELSITDCMFAHTNLEYPAFLKWCLKHKPAGCEVINTGQDLDWLAKHEAMLFPANSMLVSRWFEVVQKTAIRQYFKSHKLDIIVVGHRKADGNFVGKGSNIMTAAGGAIRYSPLADWSHELLLAYIHYHKISMPPLYRWKDGYRCGTHPWPSRMGMKSVAEGWADVYAIDPSVVKQAAEKIESAALFIKGVGA